MALAGVLIGAGLTAVGVAKVWTAPPALPVLEPEEPTTQDTGNVATKEPMDNTALVAVLNALAAAMDATLAQVDSWEQELRQTSSAAEADLVVILSARYFKAWETAKTSIYAKHNCTPVEVDAAIETYGASDATVLALLNRLRNASTSSTHVSTDLSKERVLEIVTEALETIASTIESATTDSKKLGKQETPEDKTLWSKAYVDLHSEPLPTCYSYISRANHKLKRNLSTLDDALLAAAIRRHSADAAFLSQLQALYAAHRARKHVHLNLCASLAAAANADAANEDTADVAADTLDVPTV
uniref:Secreted protein n=1 Tax=Achlya hypogyna TaxID=1202772 RepID=A0A0A7CP85_ACHHY|nr:secreted protein [Achlya hypogyna]